ncbi:RNA-binding protein [Orientia tsutsugamushi]|nr:RNA-binding protein [Orientia tsutsugamushi]
MGSIQLCQMLKDREVLSKTTITDIYNRALFLLQTEDTRYKIQDTRYKIQDTRYKIQ